MFNINDGTDAEIDVEISGLTITGGDSSLTRGGGGIFSRENLRIDDCIIAGNRANHDPLVSDGSGGGISCVSGNLVVTDSLISNNWAADSGGGIYCLGGNLSIDGSTISGNTASTDTGYGGGVYHGDDGDVTITNSTISGNTAEKFGGGISNRVGNVSISGSTVSDNTSHYFGGGLSLGSSGSITATIVGTTISGNSAVFGGGVYGSNMALTLTDCTINGNSADTDWRRYRQRANGARHQPQHDQRQRCR